MRGIYFGLHCRPQALQKAFRRFVRSTKYLAAVDLQAYPDLPHAIKNKYRDCKYLGSFDIEGTPCDGRGYFIVLAWGDRIAIANHEFERVKVRVNNQSISKRWTINVKMNMIA